MYRIVALIACLGLAAVSIPSQALAAQSQPQGIVFSESFEDADLARRNWYDGTRFRIVGDAFAGKGCIEYEWTDSQSPVRGSSAVRRLFEPTEDVANACLTRSQMEPMPAEGSRTVWPSCMSTAAIIWSITPSRRGRRVGRRSGVTARPCKKASSACRAIRYRGRWPSLRLTAANGLVGLCQFHPAPRRHVFE